MRNRIAIALTMAVAVVGLSIALPSGAVESPQPARPAVSSHVILDPSYVAWLTEYQQLSTLHAAVQQQEFYAAASSDATDAATSDWWACVITPESGGDFGDASGAYGVLGATWWAYEWVWDQFGYWSSPGAAPPLVQAAVALALYRANGGFGPSAWNNQARC